MTTWYVSTDGAGAGTLASPWPITKLADAAAVSPGDTVLLRGGWYTGALVVSLVGTEANPITIANYPGEVVVLDLPRSIAHTSTDAGVKFVSSQYVRLREHAQGGALRLTNTSHERRLTGTDQRPNGVIIDTNCVDVRLINVRCDNVGNNNHDYGNSGGGFYGCLFANIGWDAVGDRGSGHTWYVQNDPAHTRKSFVGCVSVNGYGHGVHCFGGADNKPNNVLVQDSFFANHASPSRESKLAAEMIAYGDVNYVSTLLEFDNNAAYKRLPNAGAPPSSVVMQIGVYDPWPRTHTNGTAVVTDNILVGGLAIGSPFGNDSESGLTFTGNVAVEGFHPGSPQHPMPVVDLWTENYSLGTNQNDDYDVFVALFPSNTYVTDYTAMATQARAVANAWEPGRGHVFIANANGVTTYAVDLSAICTDGENYVALNTENLEAGPEFRFTFDSSAPNITFDLSTKRAAADPYGGRIEDIRATTNQCGIWLIRRETAEVPMVARHRPTVRSVIEALDPDVWLRGDLPGSVIWSASGVSSWQDSSRNENHYEGQGTALPTFSATDTPSGRHGSVSCLLADASYLRSPEFTIPQPITILDVWRPDVLNNGRYFFHHSGSSNRCDLLQGASGLVTMYSHTAGPAFTVTAGAWYVTARVYDAADSTLHWRRLKATGSAGTQGLSATRLYLSGPSGFGSSATYAEHVVFFRRLSDAELAAAVAELEDVWTEPTTTSSPRIAIMADLDPLARTADVLTTAQARAFKLGV